MSKIADTITNPQVRQWLYGVMTVAVPILISIGVIDANQAALWLALGAAVLGTGTATVAVAAQRKSGVLPAPPPRGGNDSV